MTRRKEIKAETRALVLGAARRLLRKKGVAETTMREVAREAGVSAATVVLHFGSKIALLEAAVAEDIQHCLAEALKTMPRRATPLTALMHMPTALYKLYATDRDLYRELVKGTVFEPEELNPIITRQLAEYIGWMTDMISGFQAEGKVRKSVDPGAAALALSSLYMGVLILFFRSPGLGAQEAARMLSALTKHYLEGIAETKGGQR